MVGSRLCPIRLNARNSQQQANFMQTSSYYRKRCPALNRFLHTTFYACLGHGVPIDKHFLKLRAHYTAEQALRDWAAGQLEVNVVCESGPCVFRGESMLVPPTAERPGYLGVLK